MFDIARLPKITFVAPESEQTLHLSQCSGQIQYVADAVSRQASASSTVGLIFPIGPQLVLHWLGVLAAGRVPVMLSYPTEKMSRSYWEASIRDVIVRCNIGALLCAPELSELSPDHQALLCSLEAAGSSDAGADTLVLPAQGEILQLSSGTTGFKKAIRFGFDVLREHVERYNQVMQLGPQDCIVSWLPLSHDMGLIACLIMPLLLGVPVVLIDPITWVHQPGLLFEAIRRHRGTVCYMPNFGFEVMAKLGNTQPLPAMRHWISCSEPTYPATLERFIAATGADPKTVSTCYGMAENVFAVAQSAGLRIIEQDQRLYVSCGRPIPGTELKEVAGELFVRSPYSLATYEGGTDIRDPEGFYPTGDLGFLQDGEVVITGRKQDLANVGGQKYLLNDLDFTIGRLFPQSAGRIASLAAFDAIGGTEKILVLVEDDLFWEKERSSEPARLIREATGVEWLEVHFVPRQFITKTSSGKINRNETLKHWRACQSAVQFQDALCGELEFANELERQFPGIATDRPVEEELDSLGLVMLRLCCEEHGLAYNPHHTLKDIAGQGRRAEEPSQSQVFSIVALVDGNFLGVRAPKPYIGEAFLEAIAQAVGCPVHFEQICVPPAAVLLSDLIFHDYFLPRKPDPAYGAVAAQIRKFKEASLILVDDSDSLYLTPYCTYPVLDWQFKMQPDAELLGHRIPRYTQNHHLLPRRILFGREIKPETVDTTLRNLEKYLGIPIFKMANHAACRRYTQHWDFFAPQDIFDPLETPVNTAWLRLFLDALLAFLSKRLTECRMRTGDPRNCFSIEGYHFCSFLINRAAVDFVAQLYNSFCIIGPPSSMPYLTRRLDQLGKPYFFSSQLSPVRDDYECMLLTGAALDLAPVNKPIVDFMQVRGNGGGGRPRNVQSVIEALCPSLAVTSEQLYRAVIRKYGENYDRTIGNYLLNPTIEELLALFPPVLSIPEALLRAIRAIRAGDFAAGETFCRNILAVDPASAMAANLLEAMRQNAIMQSQAIEAVANYA